MAGAGEGLACLHPLASTELIASVGCEHTNPPPAPARNAVAVRDATGPTRRNVAPRLTLLV
jgi:hypothetical protein